MFLFSSVVLFTRQHRESEVIFLWRLKWFCDKQCYSVKGDGFGAASLSASVRWKGRERDPLAGPNGKMKVLNMKL